MFDTPGYFAEDGNEETGQPMTTNEYAHHVKMHRVYERLKEKAARPAAFAKGWPQASDAVRRAVRRGALVRPKACQECGSEVNIQAHHYLGYAPEHRLDVQWLCCRCHSRKGILSSLLPSLSSPPLPNDAEQKRTATGNRPADASPRSRPHQAKR